MKKILVIEDTQQICDVIRIYFNNEGAETVIIQDGQSAVDFIDKGLNGIGLAIVQSCSLKVILQHLLISSPCL